MFKMDQSLGPFADVSNGDEANDELAFSVSGEDLRVRLSIADVPRDRKGNRIAFSAPSLGRSCDCEVESVDPDCDFNDVVFQYISQMLMEEDIGEKIGVLHESSALEATEKSLYEAIGETYPPKGYSPISESPSEGCGLSSISDSSLDPDLEPKAELHDPFVPGIASLSMHSSAILLASSKQGLSELASKSPSNNSFSVLLDTDVSRGKRNSYSEEVGSEEEHQGRTNKQSAVYIEPEESSEMLDMVLLNGTSGESALRQSWKDERRQGSNPKVRGKKKGLKKEVIDLRTLLTLCAQAVAAGNQISAAELLKKIRLHASVMGDGMQRMAYYMADGLEARLAGSGSQIYGSLYQPTSSTRTLKAYQLFQTACPFKKLSNFFSNMTIMNATEKASKIHIIDFGIGYGFQWPCLIQRLSSRQGGPPRVRITGIDNPHPGFRPAEKIDETGNRLKNYAEKFKVPFQFNAVAKKWDTVSVEDLNLDSNEVLVVNSIYKFKNLLDETVVAASPRDTVLSLIRQTNPGIFIHGVVNAAHSAPLFIQRFRETLFHFSALFDMLETNVPRNILERALIEKEIFGRQVMNIIACEGPERVERPQTYKQWQLRNLRAGFTPLPLDDEIVRTAKDRVKAYYHKDFVIEEDGNWLLQGWKGRLVYGLSTWRPQN